MKTLITLLLTSLSLIAGMPIPQVPIAEETFGDQPGTDIGYTTSLTTFDGPGSKFFNVLDDDGTRFPQLGDAASKVFAVEDIDGENSRTGDNIATLITDGQNLSAYTNTYVEITLAAPGDASADGLTYDDNTEYDHFPTGDLTDRIVIEYTADGETLNAITHYQPEDNSFNSSLKQTTIASGVSDTPLGSPNFSTLSFPITAGPAVQVRITFASNSSGELFVVDKISIYGDPLPEFSIADASNTEGNDIVFSVSRPPTVVGGTSTVDYTTSNGTATSGSDYATASGTLTFSNTEALKYITIPTSADSTVELDENFTVTLSNATNAVITDSSATGTITNDDSATISLSGATVNEGDSGTTTMTFTASLSNPSDAVTTLAFNTTDAGTATVGSDFTQVDPTSINIPAGSTSVMYNVSILGDTDVENDETVGAYVSIFNDMGRNITGTSIGTGTITNDDIPLLAGNLNLEYDTDTSLRILFSSIYPLVTGATGNLSITSNTQPAAGSIDAKRRFFTYSPATGSTENTSFTYEITDGSQTTSGLIILTNSGSTSIPPNTISDPTVTANGNGTNTITGTGYPGRTYQLRISDDLVNWSDLGIPIVCPLTGIIAFLDPGPLPQMRFYRILEN